MLGIGWEFPSPCRAGGGSGTIAGMTRKLFGAGIGEFAARHPEVLQYVPCYCGCENVGHKANHDCFVKTRAADGRVTQWDSHGMGCAVCLGVGRRAMAMFNQGMSVPAIRAAIDREFGSHYPSH